jgi:hypothetical protein
MHGGLFRANGTSGPADGFGTFSFGPVGEAVGNLNRYNSVLFWKSAAGDGGRSHNARFHSDQQEIWTGTTPAAYLPISSQEISLDADVFPITDRATGGQLFDPAEYMIEVKFKPNVNVPGPPVQTNAAPFFQVTLDQMDGPVWDAEAGRYKRGNDAFTYNIGENTPGNTINEWYATAPKDADGFATWQVPVLEYDFVQRGFYYNFAAGGLTEREAEAITGNGRALVEGVWTDQDDGLDSLSFGGGPTGPGTTQLKIPNGVPLMAIGAPTEEAALSIELKYAALKRITPNNIYARMDENTGISYRFGSALEYGSTQPDIVVDGIPVKPRFTDQISRFDQNGMTNLVINAREPNAGEGPFRGYQYRFVVRTAPSADSFDGTDPDVMMTIRAKLLPTNTATSMTIFAKDLDGSDCSVVNLGAGCRFVDTVGADEYTTTIDLSQFSTSDFTTISIPLSSFLLSTYVPSPTTNPADLNHKDSLGPWGFAHAGDGLKTDFNLYEFGAGVVAGAGLLRMEIDYMELALTPVVPPGLLGDFNEDDKVDAADFVLWAKSGTNPLPNDNGVPTATDRYNLWRANFGSMAMPGGGAGGANVPEPATWILLTMVAAPMGFGRRRSRKSCG